MNTWFLLYDGMTPDGSGTPDYVGRTEDSKVAQKHYKQCYKNPYSCGKVIIVTDDYSKMADQVTIWENL